MITYKGKYNSANVMLDEEAGRQIVRINRWEPTSKKCSGAINQELKLRHRKWVCKVCGAVHDRDYNGATNINTAGQAVQELTYAVA